MTAPRLFLALALLLLAGCASSQVPPASRPSIPLATALLVTADWGPLSARDEAELRPEIIEYLTERGYLGNGNDLVDQAEADRLIRVVVNRAGGFSVRIFTLDPGPQGRRVIAREPLHVDIPPVYSSYAPTYIDPTYYGGHYSNPPVVRPPRDSNYHPRGSPDVNQRYPRHGDYPRAPRHDDARRHHPDRSPGTPSAPPATGHNPAPPPTYTPPPPAERAPPANVETASSLRETSSPKQEVEK